MGGAEGAAVSAELECLASANPDPRTPLKAARRLRDSSSQLSRQNCMVPAALSTRSRTPGLFYTVASLIVNNVPKLLHGTSARGSSDSDAAAALTMHTFAKRHEKHNAKFIVFACLIPILVLLSGLFAGLTLGYMSLDETQLHVLSVSGTP